MLDFHIGRVSISLICLGFLCFTFPTDDLVTGLVWRGMCVCVPNRRPTCESCRKGYLFQTGDLLAGLVGRMCVSCFTSVSLIPVCWALWSCDHQSDVLGFVDVHPSV